MSATIYARQVKPITGTSISCSWPSSFMDIMTRAFGRFPLELNDINVDKLTAMAATIDKGKDNPYQEIIDLVEKLGTVEVYAKY